MTDVPVRKAEKWQYRRRRVLIFGISVLSVIEILKILVKLKKNNLQQLRILYVCCSAL